MGAQVESGELYRLEGSVETIVFHNPENGYTVLELATDEELMTVVGEFADISVGETLIVTGTYRGDPLYQTVKIEGRFTRTAVNGDGTEAEDAVEPRFLDGRALLFAEVPEDGAVSDISDGLFLFIPDVQREAELQGEASGCNDASLLPAQMRAVLSRTDQPTLPDSQRVTAETLWINTPGGTDLPVIVLEEGE